MMRRHLNLLLEAVASLLRRSGRSGVVLCCLLGVLLPFVAASALSEGVRSQSIMSVEAGADLYVSREQYGRNGPISLKMVERFEKIPGVMRVVPRIVGRTYLGEELAVVVGIDRFADFSPSRTEHPLDAEQAYFGSSLARRLDLAPGDEFRFFLNPALPFSVAGLLEPELSIWSGSMVVISFDAAQQVFKLPGMASELLLYCRPGTAESVADHLSSLGKPWEMQPPLRIQTRKIVRRYVNRGFDIQAGMFTMLYVTAFGLSVPALLILSGLGRGVRRREIGIMKAVGWQTLEVLEMTFFENLLLALLGSLLAVVFAMLWLKLGNGIGIAPLFISGAGWIPDFAVPSRFLPLPVLYSFLFGLVLTMIGTLVPTWKAAVTPPLTTMS